jgi:DNA-binding transcriptional ArsR family regulator
MANDAFTALAHPIRRDIVARLSGGAATVGEASRDLGVSKPTISRHLTLLEEAGIVTRSIDGRTHRLALRPDTLAETAAWIDEQRLRWSGCSSSSANTSRSVRATRPAHSRVGASPRPDDQALTVKKPGDDPPSHSVGD